jgi:hypothetical protein
MKTTLAKRNSARESTFTERDRRILRRIVSKNDITTAAQVIGQQNWIFILKTLFPQEMSDASFTNPISTVGLQFLNLWLLKVILTIIGNGVMTITSGHQTTGNAAWYGQMSRSSLCFLHQEKLYFENIQGSLKSRMPFFNSEMRGILYNGLGSNIVAFFWSHYYP